MHQAIAGVDGKKNRGDARQLCWQRSTAVSYPRGLYDRCEILRMNMGEGKCEVAGCLAISVDVRSRVP